MNKTSLSYIFAALTILFWGTAATAFKLTLRHINFVQLLAWSSFFSTIILFGIVLITGKFKELLAVPRKEIYPSIVLGFINPFAYYFILFKAYELLPAQMAQPLNFIWPLVLVLLSVPMLGEKLTTKSILSLIISFLGVILISSQGNFSIQGIESPLGVFLALFSSLIWALYWILNLRPSKIDQVSRLFLNFGFATIFSFTAGFFFNDFWSINLLGIFGSIYVGAFEMGITFVLWLKALSLTNSKAKLGNVIYVIPFLSLVFINLVVGERIIWTTIVGLVIIVGSIIFQQVNNVKLKKQKQLIA